ncbi:MAG TPA: ABC transporter permease [Feifaniaceae bacterium]|nr:ABC transporter permease [Feifaniaceae bacterium]
MKANSPIRSILHRNEFYVAMAVLALCIVIGIKNPVFFTANNAVDLLKAAVVNGIMVYAVMLGIIAGGIDVSFPAIAVCSMYITSKLCDTIAYNGPVVFPILLSVCIGTALGAINGLIISMFELPAFIVTLGTSNVFHGLLISLMGAKPVNRLVPPMEAMSKAEIFHVQGENYISILPVTFWFLLAIIAIVYVLLNYTMLGRGIYALGGDRVSAERAGFNIKGITIFVYTFIGFASGLAGICHTIQARTCVPTDLMGSELIIIAAAVLGGTNIAGGKGTVLGTTLGLALITIARNSLILMGIPPTAQRAVVGLIIVAGTGISAYQAMKEANRIPKVMDDEPCKEG